MSPSVNPKPPFTSWSLASGDTSASSAGSSLTTAGLSACDCASTAQTPRVANRTAVEIDKFFMRSSTSELRPPQPQRVGDHRHRAHRHCGAGEDRRQQQTEEGIEHARSDRNAERVVDKSKEQILLDVAHGRAREADRLDDSA